MPKFTLKTKTGEQINVTTQEDIDDAIEFFASLKQLKIKELLKIYIVEEYEDRDSN